MGLGPVRTWWGGGMTFYCSDGLTVYNADVLDALPALEPGSVDAVVTSPPYAMQRASTYGGVPEKDYPDWTVEWMNALKPALTERGSVMLNISPHVKGGLLADYVLRMRLALRADGWYEHDELVWVKPNAFPTGDTKRPARSWTRQGEGWAVSMRQGFIEHRSGPTRAPLSTRYLSGCAARTSFRSELGEGLLSGLSTQPRSLSLSLTG